MNTCLHGVKFRHSTYFENWMLCGKRRVLTIGLKPKNTHTQKSQSEKIKKKTKRQHYSLHKKRQRWVTTQKNNTFLRQRSTKARVKDFYFHKIECSFGVNRHRSTINHACTIAPLLFVSRIPKEVYVVRELWQLVPFRTTPGAENTVLLQCLLFNYFINNVNFR